MYEPVKPISTVHKRVLNRRISSNLKLKIAKKKKKQMKNIRNFTNAAHINKFKMKVLKKIAKLEPNQSRQNVNIPKEVVQQFAKKYHIPLSKLIRALRQFSINYHKMKYKNGFASATPSNNSDLFKKLKI